MSFSSPPDRSTFSRDRHVKYWLRCLKTFLPNLYTSNDSNRMTLALFTISALDLLGVLHDHTSAADRQAYIDWIYLCQHPDGGFRGFTGTNFGDAARNAENGRWDPANVAGTFFALAGLGILGDSFERVKRKECLEWLSKLQWEDGSFGELMGEDNTIYGRHDIRYCYMATAVRWILSGHGGGLEDVSDIDVDALATFVLASKTYDGGIGNAPFGEAHAGWTYCGIGTLWMLGKLPPPYSKHTSDGGLVFADDEFVQDILNWLVYRQTTTLLEDEPPFQISDEGPLSVQSIPPHHLENPAPNAHEAPMNLHETSAAESVASTTPPIPPLIPTWSTPIPLFHVQGASTEAPAHTPSFLPSSSASLRPNAEDLLFVGFSGRCNKFADTCYSFWAGGALAILKKTHLISFNSVRRYLLEKSQHLVGGFGKLPGDPPDILHSYLGLAALAVMKEPSLKSLDPTLCISVSAREHIQSLPWWQGAVDTATTSPSSNTSKAQRDREKEFLMIGG